MNKNRVDEISTLLIKDQLRRKGALKKDTLLDELGEDAPAQLNLTPNELLEYTRIIVGEAIAEIEETPAERFVFALARGLHKIWEEKENA